MTSMPLISLSKLLTRTVVKPHFFLPFLQQTLLLIMASGALFPSLVSGSRGSSSKYLVEFRAGKMTMKGSTVTPDKRKGQVYIQQTDDSLIHFCWKDRTTGNVDDVGKQADPKSRGGFLK